MPHLIGMMSGRSDAADALKSNLGPSEAVYLFLSLIVQKFYSPPFQLTQEEFHVMQRRGPLPGSPRRFSPRHDEIVSMVSLKASQAGLWELLKTSKTNP